MDREKLEKFGIVPSGKIEEANNKVKLSIDSKTNTKVLSSDEWLGWTFDIDLVGFEYNGKDWKNYYSFEQYEEISSFDLLDLISQVWKKRISITIKIGLVNLIEDVFEPQANFRNGAVKKEILQNHILKKYS